MRCRLKPGLKKLTGEKRYELLRYYTFIRFYPHGGYTHEYYENIEAANTWCYSLLAQRLMEEFHPKILVDVGCGGGGIAKAFQNVGCPAIHCFDNSEEALKRARGQGLKSVHKWDLTCGRPIPFIADLCICLEVAEHLPENFADGLCRSLAAIAPVLVFTAAPPGQGGHLHVNEQPREYWISHFAAFGMRHDDETLKRIRRSFAEKMIPDYDKNLMVFRRVR